MNGATEQYLKFWDGMLARFAILDFDSNAARQAAKIVAQLKNVYTTNTNEFFTTCMEVYVPFIMKHGIQQATTLLEVKGLFATFTLELEATAVK